ncbi:MAG: thioredoxin family protein [Pseudomonadota bacterium]
MSSGKFQATGNGRGVRGFLPVSAVLLVGLALFSAGASGRVEAAETVVDRFPGLSNGILKAARPVDLPSGVILESGAIVVKESDLLAGLKGVDPKLRTQVDNNLFFFLEQEATRQLLLDEAKKAGAVPAGKNEEVIIETFLESVAARATASDEEVSSFYDENQDMIGGAKLEEVRDSIRRLLVQQKKAAVVEEFIRDLGRGREIKLDRAWTERQFALAMDNPVDRARRSGKPSMIEFGATGCIPCDRMRPILDSLQKNHGAKLNVVFVHVREEQVLGARFGIRTIPVQVFFDAQGREAFRHEGFFPEEKIIPILKKLGVG